MPVKRASMNMDKSTEPSKQTCWSLGLSRGLIVLLTLLCGAALIFLVMITCIDVFGRWLFNHPLMGSTELTELGLSIIVFSSLPFVCWRDENIVVDMFDRHYAPRLAQVRAITIHLISAVCLGFVGQRLFALGSRSLSFGEVSEHLTIPLGWFMWMMGALCWLSVMGILSFGIMGALKPNSQATMGQRR